METPQSIPPEAARRNIEINQASGDDINDLNNLEIRSLAEVEGIVSKGEIVTENDYESIRRRAEVLLTDTTRPLSVKAALLEAFVERMRIFEKIGMERMRELSDDAIRAILYAETGEQYTNEEIAGWRKSNMLPKEWAKKRNEAKKSLQ